MRSIDEKVVAELVQRLEAAEYRLSRILLDESKEISVRDIAVVLHDLSAIRLWLEQPSPDDKRVHGRFHEPVVSVSRRPDGTVESIALIDISAGGALIEFDTPRQVGQRINIELPGLDKDVPVVVKGVNGNQAHVAFVELAPDDLLVLLKYVERHFERY